MEEEESIGYETGVSPALTISIEDVSSQSPARMPVSGRNVGVMDTPPSRAPGPMAVREGQAGRIPAQGPADVTQLDVLAPFHSQGELKG